MEEPLKPHEYQLKAAQWIVDHAFCALFLDMGLGKTLSTLLALERLKPLLDRVLIVAPLAVARQTWPAEIRKWHFDRTFSFAVACGTARERKDALYQNADLTIINVENLEWLIKLYGNDWPFDTVIIDELSCFKNRKARRFKALKWIRARVSQFVGLTGTPAPNGLLGLWSQMYGVDRGERLGKFFTHYRDQYFYIPNTYKDPRFDTSFEPRPGAEERIYEALSDIVLSMRAKDYLDLPACVTTNRDIVLSATERATYERLERERVLDIADDEITADSAGVLSGKLLQLASGAIYNDDGDTVIVHRAKLDALRDEVEAANGQSVLIAYWFKHSKDRILEEFPEAVIYQPDMEREWSAGKIPLALVHPASVGHGLNLQHGGHIIIWYDLIFNLELYQQLNGRLNRQGQQTTVSVRHLVAHGTIDEKVLAVLAGKASAQEALQEALKEAKERNSNQ